MNIMRFDDRTLNNCFKYDQLCIKDGRIRAITDLDYYILIKLTERIYKSNNTENGLPIYLNSLNI